MKLTVVAILAAAAEATNINSLGQSTVQQTVIPTMLFTLTQNQILCDRLVPWNDGKCETEYECEMLAEILSLNDLFRCTGDGRIAN